jgi:RNA polymerase sigma-70 factor (ECF subfamily)
MRMREITLNELELQPVISEADDTLQMDQDSFRSLYERTARPLWVYLCRKTGRTELADELLQETYYRFLRVRLVFESDSHRKNYLFKIATNLANDHYRGATDEQLPENYEAGAALQDPGQKTDVGRAMARLKPRERDALWLAYAEGLSHKEIAQTLGVKVTSMKILLFRARQKFVTLLRGAQ